MKKIAVYAGTFDPMTNGHLWMIEQGVKLFDQLVVAIGDNPDKRCVFTAEDRLWMLQCTTKQFKKLRIDTFPFQFLVDYAQSIGAQFVLRGIRNESDYEYERGMRHVNGDLNPDITVVFLMPPREIAEVASSMVKKLIGPEGWERVVRKYVPEPVFLKLKEAHNAKSA